MVSEEFRSAIKAELDAMDKAKLEAIEKRKEADRLAKEDLDWFHEHLDTQIENAVAAVQSVDPERRILGIVVGDDRPRGSAPGKQITVNIHREKYGSYTRKATCHLRSGNVELLPEATSYGRSNGHRGDAMPQTAACTRAKFNTAWLVKALEAFVMHTKQNPPSPL